jgi:hypothetical protein
MEGIPNGDFGIYFGIYFKEFIATNKNAGFTILGTTPFLKIANRNRNVELPRRRSLPRIFHRPSHSPPPSRQV